MAPGSEVQALSDAVQVAVSSGLGCATTQTGQVACWPLSEPVPSRDSGSRRLRRTAKRVVGIDNARSVALGRLRGCALLETGEVACWDVNDGIPGRPQRIDGVRDARSLVMMPSSDVFCAVTARRTLTCSAPAAVSLADFPSGWESGRAVEHPTLNDVRGVAFSQTHYCVLHGGGRTTCSGFAGEPPQLTGAHQIVATDGVTCALTRARGVACWGAPALIGAGERTATAGFVEQPRDVAGLTRVAALSAGEDSVCALLLDGTGRCWGRNHTGGLGDGSLVQRFVPVPLCNARGIVQLAAGRQSCALFGSGSVRCWGDLDALEYE